MQFDSVMLSSAQNRDFCLPHLQSTPPLGVPVGISPSRLVRENENGVSAGWWKRFKDIFIRFDTTHEPDRHTDTQTPHDGIDRAYASHRTEKIGQLSIFIADGEKMTSFPKSYISIIWVNRTTQNLIGWWVLVKK